MLFCFLLLENGQGGSSYYMGVICENIMHKRALLVCILYCQVSKVFLLNDHFVCLPLLGCVGLSCICHEMYHYIVKVATKNEN